jgi:poly(3-hydroxybutyrate) depolymerase
VIWTKQTLFVDGMPRRWLFVKPTGAGRLVPAVVFLHGLDDLNISDQTRGQYQCIAANARKLGFIAALPRGSVGALPAQPASVGWGPVAEDENVRFIRQLAGTLVHDHDADPARLILAGFSNGAFLAAKELLRDTPFTAFFLSAGGEPAACAISGRRPQAYIEIGTEDAHQLPLVRRLLEHLRSSGWIEGQTLQTVEHPGGHMLYATDFANIWSFLTR